MFFILNFLRNTFTSLTFGLQQHVCLSVYVVGCETVLEEKLNLRKYRHKKGVVGDRGNIHAEGKDSENKIVKETHNYTEIIF